MKKRLPLVLALSLMFPLVNLAIYTLRFQAPQGRLYLESLLFAPIGLIGGLIFFHAYDKAGTRVHKNAIVVGFLLAMPLAVLGGLMGGLLGIVATIAFGTLPLALGVLLGNWFGSLLAKEAG